MRTRGQSFLGGAATLMAAAVLVKVIGALFKIPLAAALGGEGMGYYMTAYSVFNPVFALSAAGFPIAVSKLTAAAAAQHRFNDRKRVLNVAMAIFLSIGLALWAAVYFGAPYFLVAANNASALKAVRSMAPAVFFCCVTSVFRGYYEGGRNMLPTAVSQVTEAVVKLVFGLYFANRCIQGALADFNACQKVFGVAVNDLSQAMTVISPHAAAAAVSGVAVSTAAGSLIMALFYLFYENEPTSGRYTMSRKKTAYLLMQVAFPVCAGALVINLSSLVDLFSVMNRIDLAAARDWEALCKSHPEAMLEAMEGERLANFLYGSYTGLAMTVFNLVPAVTSSIGICALPMISAAAARGNKAQLRLRIEAVLRLTVIIAMPMGLGISCMAAPILNVLFKSNPLEAAVAARLLQPLGVAAVFVAISSAVSSMLQAVGRALAPVLLLLAGSMIKLAVNWMLISRPEMNIVGAPYGTLCCYMFIALAGIRLLDEATDHGTGLFPMMLKPFIASAFCCAGAVLMMRLLKGSFSDTFSLIISTAFGAAIYLILLLLTGGVTRDDIYLLKKPSKMKKVPL